MMDSIKKKGLYYKKNKVNDLKNKNKNVLYLHLDHVK